MINSEKKIRILAYAPNIDRPLSGSLIHTSNVYFILERFAHLDITYLIHKKNDHQFWLNRKHILCPRIPLYSNFLKYRNKFDLLHLGVLTIFAPFLAQIKIKVATIHGGAIYENPSNYNLLVRLHNLVTRRLVLHRLNKVYTVSNYSKRLIEAYDKVDLKDILIVSNGISKNISKNTSVDTEKYFFHVSKFSLRKNPFYLLDCFKDFNRKHPDVYLKIGGSGWDNDLVNHYINKKNISNVIILGRIDEETLSKMYSNSIGHLFLSLSEGFGLPIIEALKCECLSIYNDVGALSEIAGGFGYCTSNKEEVLKAMSMLFCNKPKISSKDVNKYCANFDWITVANRYNNSFIRLHEKN